MKTFAHGIHTYDAKDLTANLAIKRLPISPRLILLLSQHIGSPAKPIVKEGEQISYGQVIAEASAHCSAPIHAPVTGIVKSIAQAINQAGKLAPAIFIEPDKDFIANESYDAQNSTSKVYPPVDDVLAKLSREDILARLKDSGLVGLGGAAFPTHVKFYIPENKKVDTLIINACECEPFLTSDYRIMLEYTDWLILGIKFAMKALGIHRAIIGIEDNKPEAITILNARINSEIKLEVCKTKYPQGAEKMLIKALLNREVPTAGLPLDVGVVCANVSTITALAYLISNNVGLTKRVVTVTGDGIEKVGNYLIPFGTPLSFILEHVGLKTDTYEVLFGGPMMGSAVMYLGTPTTKGTGGIVVLKRPNLTKQLAYNKINPCIRCGECLNVCPMHLNPSQLGRLGHAKHYQEMSEKYHLFDCFECGCCTYVCTAAIPLVQQFRVAKQILRKK